MPSVLAHNLLSKQVYDNAVPESTDKNAFLLGGLGPDFFYASKNPSLAKLGSLFHHSDACKTLTAMLEIARGNNIAYSFALGFLTHYALDSIAHPFVLAVIDEMLPLCRRATEDTLHDKIETNLDVIILRNKTGQIPSEIPLKELIPQDTELLDAVSSPLAQTANTLFEANIKPEEVKTAYDEYRRFLNKYQDNTGIKRPFYKRLEILRNIPPIHSSRIRSIMEDDDFDYSNSSKTAWTHNGAECRADFFEMFDDAAALSDKLIKAADDNLPLKPIIGDIGFI